MSFDRRRPWSRTGSILSTRYSARAITPDTPPTPDPNPPDDDDDDLQHWVGSGATASAGGHMTLYALARSRGRSPAGGLRAAALFASHEGFGLPFTVARSLHVDGGSAASGSVPARVGRQAARRYRSDDRTRGSTSFQTYLVSPEKETIGAGPGHPPMTNHLYFAWLTGDQYQALRREGQHHARRAAPLFDRKRQRHAVLTFAEPPVFTVRQPSVTVSGTLDASPTVRWLSLRVTLFGSVGLGVGPGRPDRVWTYSQPAAPSVDRRFSFGAPDGAAIAGADVDRQPLRAVWVAGWGLYRHQGRTYAAVTPPLQVAGACLVPGLSGAGQRPLPPGRLVPSARRPAKGPPPPIPRAPEGRGLGAPIRLTAG